MDDRDVPGAGLGEAEQTCPRPGPDQQAGCFQQLSTGL